MRTSLFASVLLFATALAPMAVAQSIPGSGCPVPGATPLVGVPATTATPATILPGYVPCIGNPGWVIVGYIGPSTTLASPPFCSPGPCITTCIPLGVVFIANQGRTSINVPGLPPSTFCLHIACITGGCFSLSQTWVMTTT